MTATGEPRSPGTERAATPPHAGIFALVHHVELAKAKWWERCVQDLVLSAIYQSRTALSEQDIAEVLRVQGEIDVPADRLRRAIEQLLSQAALRRVDMDRFTLSEGARKEIVSASEDVAKATEGARSTFLQLARQHCPEKISSDTDADVLWEKFNRLFLVPLVRDAGAQTWALLAGSANGRPAAFAEALLSDFANGEDAHLNILCTEFLHRPDEATRSHVLQILNGYLVLHSSSLDRATIESIAGGLKKDLVFSAFVDTNLLYSALTLHDNPLNAATADLLACLRQLPANVKVHLAVLPQTVDEFKRSVNYWRRKLTGIRITDNIAEGLEASGLSLSGVARKFIEESRRTGRAFSAESYFDPYLNSLLTIVRQHGIEYHNEDLNAYRTDQRVIDDIIDTQDHYARNPHLKAKSYEELEHDYSLWYATYDKRSKAVESPGDARYWVLTVDYRFVAYDARQRSQRRTRVPVCLSPEAFLNILQLWTPRSEALDRALVGNLRNPFLFRPFDADSERVTLQILESLSRFENLADLPSETATAVLVNEALRHRLETVESDARAIELVREALIAENRGASARIADLATREAAAKSGLAVREKELDELQAETKRLRDLVEAEQKRTAEQEAKLANYQRGEMQRARNAALFALFALVPAAGWSGWRLGSVLSRFDLWGLNPPPLVAGLAVVATAEIWLAVVRRRDWGRSDPRHRRIRIFLRTLEAAAVLGPVGNFVYDLIRRG